MGNSVLYQKVADLMEKEFARLARDKLLGVPTEIGKGRFSDVCSVAVDDLPPGTFFLSHRWTYSKKREYSYIVPAYLVSPYGRRDSHFVVMEDSVYKLVMNYSGVDVPDLDSELVHDFYRDNLQELVVAVEDKYKECLSDRYATFEFDTVRLHMREMWSGGHDSGIQTCVEADGKIVYDFILAVDQSGNDTGMELLDVVFDGENLDFQIRVDYFERKYNEETGEKEDELLGYDEDTIRFRLSDLVLEIREPDR